MANSSMVVIMQKGVQLQGALPPDPRTHVGYSAQDHRYRFALRAHRVKPKLWPWIRQWYRHHVLYEYMW